MTDKCAYLPCQGCGEMLDEARGDIESWQDDKPYCLYCHALLPLTINGKNLVAVALGKRGGKTKSEAKTEAARANAKKPRKKRKPVE